VVEGFGVGGEACQCWGDEKLGKRVPDLGQECLGRIAGLANVGLWNVGVHDGLEARNGLGGRYEWGDRSGGRCGQRRQEQPSESGWVCRPVRGGDREAGDALVREVRAAIALVPGRRPMAGQEVCVWEREACRGSLRGWYRSWLGGGCLGHAHRGVCGVNGLKQDHDELAGHHRGASRRPLALSQGHPERADHGRLECGILLLRDGVRVGVRVSPPHLGLFLTDPRLERQMF
jgi:hypothetical protein